MTRPSAADSHALAAPVRARRIMLYSHDTYGLGHLRRNLRIARHLLGSAPELQIVLVSGSPVAEYFPTPPGLRIVKLPSVRKVGAEQYRPLHSGLDINLVRRIRTAIMVDLVRRFRPDVLLVDHSPAGMNGELLDVFAAVKDHSPATRVALGLRDILDDPATVVQLWSEQGIYSLLAGVYDHIVVYGSRDVFDVGSHYRLPAPVADRLVYAGYIAPDGSRDGSGGRHLPPTDPYLLATAGGGGDGVATLAAAMEAGASLGIATKVVAGPLIEDEAFDFLLDRAEQRVGVDVVKFHPHLHSAMAEASAIVTMGGYNSLCEAISVGTPTVVVPRSQPRLEQTIRADIFAARGLVSVVPAGPDLGGRLARAVQEAVVKPAPGRPLDLRGLDRLSSLLLAGAPGQSAGATERDEGPEPERLAERLPA
ncbi:MAG TPA: glycosyltransferase [Acidimicrobiales bacterium]|nr:glycosyltransferase [Acidimicrobiales bacterium]